MGRQFLLNATECSGRGVRIRILSPDEKMAASKKAIETLSEVGEVLLVTLRETETLERIKMMLVAVTKSGGYKDPRQLAPGALAESEWQKLDVGALTMPGAFSYSTLFNTKDDELLRAIYKRLHEVSQNEIDSVFSQGTDVSPTATASAT